MQTLRALRPRFHTLQSFQLLRHTRFRKYAQLILRPCEYHINRNLRIIVVVPAADGVDMIFGNVVVAGAEIGVRIGDDMAFVLLCSQSAHIAPIGATQSRIIRQFHFDINTLPLV